MEPSNLPPKSPFNDIVVRVPKSEVAHFWDDHDQPFEFWTLGKTPTRFEAGNFIYFQIDDMIVAKAQVCKVISKMDEPQAGDGPEKIVDKNLESMNTLICESTGRSWTGTHLVWMIQDFTRIDPPIPGTAVTRGFRYRGTPDGRSISL